MTASALNIEELLNLGNEAANNLSTSNQLFFGQDPAEIKTFTQTEHAKNMIRYAALGKGEAGERQLMLTARDLRSDNPYIDMGRAEKLAMKADKEGMTDFAKTAAQLELTTELTAEEAYELMKEIRAKTGEIDPAKIGSIIQHHANVTSDANFAVLKELLSSSEAVQFFQTPDKLSLFAAQVEQLELHNLDAFRDIKKDEETLASVFTAIEKLRNPGSSDAEKKGAEKGEDIARQLNASDQQARAEGVRKLMLELLQVKDAKMRDSLLRKLDGEGGVNLPEALRPILNEFEQISAKKDLTVSPTLQQDTYAAATRSEPYFQVAKQYAKNEQNYMETQDGLNGLIAPLLTHIAKLGDSLYLDRVMPILADTLTSLTVIGLSGVAIWKIIQNLRGKNKEDEQQSGKQECICCCCGHGGQGAGGKSNTGGRTGSKRSNKKSRRKQKGSGKKAQSTRPNVGGPDLTSVSGDQHPGNQAPETKKGMFGRLWEKGKHAAGGLWEKGKGLFGGVWQKAKNLPGLKKVSTLAALGGAASVLLGTGGKASAAEVATAMGMEAGEDPKDFLTGKAVELGGEAVGTVVGASLGGIISSMVAGSAIGSVIPGAGTLIGGAIGLGMGALGAMGGKALFEKAKSWWKESKKPMPSQPVTPVPPIPVSSPAKPAPAGMTPPAITIASMPITLQADGVLQDVSGMLRLLQDPAVSGKIKQMIETAFIDALETGGRGALA